MPCYEVRTVSVEFKVGNIELLKKAIEKMDWKVTSSTEKRLYAQKNTGQWGDEVTINLENSTINSTNFRDIKALSQFSNEIKRAYSEVVIDELAKKQKWIKKQMGTNQFQLQRF